MTSGEKVQRVGINIVKFVTLLGLLYLFICSLDFLSQAFRLVGGRSASEYRMWRSGGLVVGSLQSLRFER